MKQQPSRFKYRKNHKVNKSFFFLKSNNTFLPIYGRYALKALTPAKISFANLESARKSIRRNVGKPSRIFIRFFTAHSVTRKPIAVRMGSGKGNHSFWMCPIRAGQILFEVNGVSIYCKKALQRASKKLPCKCRVISLSF